jgi:hypothetical protein
MFVVDRCRGKFVCGSGRQLSCSACSFSAGCTTARRNCSCLVAPRLPNGVALQHPKPPRDDRNLQALRFAPCPDTTRCPSRAESKRVLVMQGAREDAAFGNLFYAMLSNFVLYAWRKRLVPHLNFEPSWVGKTMGTAWARDGGELWESFFEGYCPNVTAWLARGCPHLSRARPKPKTFYYPGIQMHFKWPIHTWYNAESPARVACEETQTCDRFDAAQFQKWRLQAHAVVRRVHVLNPETRARVEALWHAVSGRHF